MSRITDQYWIDLKEEAVKNVKQTFKNGEQITIPIIQRRCKLGYNAASMAYQQLNKERLITKDKGALSITVYIG